MTEVKLNTQALRDQKLERGLTDEEFADLLGISIRSLQRWLAGDTGPTWNRIVRLARRLEVEPSSLIVRDEVPA